MVDQALAGFCTYDGRQAAPPAAVPEFDGPGALAAIALLVGVGVVLYNKVRK